jgi:hypothetical protein
LFFLFGGGGTDFKDDREGRPRQELTEFVQDFFLHRYGLRWGGEGIKKRKGSCMMRKRLKDAFIQFFRSTAEAHLLEFVSALDKITVRSSFYFIFLSFLFYIFFFCLLVFSF